MSHIDILTLEVGQEVGSDSFTFTRDALVKYAGASGDFNPIHYRDDFAKSVGLDGVLAHGMLTMGAAVQVAVNWVGDAGKVIDYGVRFTKPVFVPADGKAEVVVTGRMQQRDPLSCRTNGEGTAGSQTPKRMTIAGNFGN